MSQPITDINALVPNETRVCHTETGEQGLVLAVLPQAGLVRVRFDDESPSDDVGAKYLMVIS